MVVVLVVLAGVLGYYFYHRHQVLKLLSAEGIYQRVTVDGISLEGMSKEEALATLEDKYVTEINGQVLTFQFDEETKWEVPFTDLALVTIWKKLWTGLQHRRRRHGQRTFSGRGAAAEGRY
ncbi:MAG: hypothetical protein V8Q36_08420 [Anaerotignum sp.]